MHDIALLTAAWRVSGLPKSRFAREVLARNESTLHRWLQGKHRIPESVSVQCSRIVDKSVRARARLTRSAP